MSISGKYAIVGRGLTKMGRVPGYTHLGFAAEAFKKALDDAGLAKEDVDGLLLNPGPSWVAGGTMGAATLHQYLGLKNLRLSMALQTGGGTGGAMIQQACEAIDAGICNTVVCVFSDNPFSKTATGVAYGSAGAFESPYGFFGVTASYAMAARRHMHLYGTTSEQLGAVAVATRAWAVKNPLAQMREPITLQDHQDSRWIVEPLHLLDCCLVSNGGLAFVITSAERAKNLRQPPVYVLGMGQGHPGHMRIAEAEDMTTSGAALSAETAFRMAGVKREDIDVCEIYDCYTFTVLATLEGYGFCAKGEGGPFVADGKLGPGGSLPTNTGGGQLSGYYMWGLTPISEAVIQLRGAGGERQVPGASLALVSGNGGILSSHTTTILGN